MKSTRNKYIDILRVIALAYIIIYHIYAVSHLTFSSELLNSIISMGGEIGVSVFFVISGFSIYKLLQKKGNNYSYKEYISDRIKRIGPHYYISLIVMLLFSECAIYLSINYLLNIISHIFFFHNLFYSYHGAISGVLWTMGVIFQFYLIAPFLKKGIDRHPFITTFVSIIATLLIKYVLFMYLLPMNNVDTMYYFIYGRQLFTSFDSFALGMLASKFAESSESNKNWLLVVLSIIAIAIMTLLGSGYLPILENASVHSATLKGVFYFVVLDLFIALLIYALSNCKYHETKVNNILLYFSKHEYAIYVWHLLIMNYFIKYSLVFNSLKSKSLTLTYLVVFVFVSVMSLLIDYVISNINFENLLSSIKQLLFSIKKYLYIIVILIVFVYSLTLVPKIINCIKNFNVDTCSESCIIYSNVKDKIKCGKEQCSYIYVDKEDSGYLYFYQLRYYLSPNITKHYNSYVYEINYGSNAEFINFFKSIDVDYVIVNDNDKMREYGYDLLPGKGKVYTINKNSNSIDKLFKEVQ